MSRSQILRENIVKESPRDDLIRKDRFPHIWCPGCSLGTVLKCYVEAIASSNIPIDKHVVVSGIGCTGRIAGYIKLDSYHVTHGRPIAFAEGMRIVRPDLEVTVISGDGDLVTIGGNHFIHAIRRNVDINVFLVNNFIYGMTGNQMGSTTPIGARSSTSPYGCPEYPFNLPLLVASLGAPFVARWTTLHVRQLADAMKRALQVKGFAFIEIITSCPVGFGSYNELREGLDFIKLFRDSCVVDHNADLTKVGITLRPGEPIVLGNFVDREVPTYHDLEKEVFKKAGWLK
ncbi:MAG: thiamine pyrophosphate-dependent enzyme [Aigarchaeota archaeon]|nr:thiamine pyrophosphate-dependent enzyme [Aigarchaeota archaeon]MCX8193297.1 thiamine pyrophosphate-dependent enzyme [Nitrososphaeria archaeon]MDW7986516.1 thiamine pyrophosphate-dependent enzyme [Nitrososphaerota archaeon]